MNSGPYWYNEVRAAHGLEVISGSQDAQVSD
jgi:hypothetical protein